MEKTIFIRCHEQTNKLLEKIRKAEMPHRSRNSEIIYLIHKEAERLGIDAEDEKVEEKKEDIKLGLTGLVQKAQQGSPR
jgi:hypothetical protein